MGDETPTPQDPADAADRSHATADQAFERLYAELRSLARLYLAGEREEHTLQPTALVHEAYLRLLRSENPPTGSPEHLYRSAALAMRRILIDHARKKAALRRGRRPTRLTLDAVELAATGNLDEILAVEEAIARLHREGPEIAEVVRLRFYVGLSVEEAARAVGRSERSVHRDWSYAKAFLYRSLRPDTS